MSEALLLVKDLKASTHKGVISLFGKHFVKTGIFSREMGKLHNEIYNERLIGDYSVGFTLTEEES